jgi:hypothetical protein
MAERETGDPDIRIGRLNNRADSVRPSHQQWTVRWLIFAAWVVALDAAAIDWTIAARERISNGGVVAGGVGYHSYRGYDGSQWTVENHGTGKTTVHWTDPPTRTGLCYVWWPSLAGGLTTLLALALAATRTGRRLIVEFPLPPMTTRRWMIAVAVIGIEAGLIIGATRILGVDPRSSRWPPILIGLAALPTLAFLPAFGRTRSAGGEMKSGFELVRTAFRATMEGRETGGRDIQIGHGNDRADSVRPSHLQWAVRWLIFAAWVVGLDAVAINWTIRATERIMDGPGGFSRNGSWRSYSGYDGSAGIVVRDRPNGKTPEFHLVRPPTAMGLCYVWWPAFAGGLTTLLALALAATRNGRRLIGEFLLHRPTSRRWMIAVAVISIEAVLFLDEMRYFGVDLRASRWPPILIYLAALPTLAFLPAFGRTQSAGAERNSFGRK